MPRTPSRRNTDSTMSSTSPWRGDATAPPTSTTVLISPLGYTADRGPGVRRGRAYAWGVVALASLCLSGTAKANPAKIVGEQPVDDRHGIELTISTPAFSAPAKVQVFLPAGYDAQPHRPRAGVRPPPPPPPAPTPPRRRPVPHPPRPAERPRAFFCPGCGSLYTPPPRLAPAPRRGGRGGRGDGNTGGPGAPPMYET